MTGGAAMAAALVLALATRGGAAPTEEAARDAVARRDFEKARRLYAELQSAHPDALGYAVWEARLTSWLDDYERADALYDRVLARDPEHLEALVGKAYVASWDRRYEEADLLLERAERVAPADPDVAEARAATARARAWRALSIDGSRIEVGTGFQYESYSYTDAAYMAFVRGRYHPGRFRYLLEVQQWDKFDERSTRVGAGVAGRLRPKWPFALEAWVDPGSDVLPEYDLRAGIGRVLPWRIGAGLDYRYAAFPDVRVHIGSLALEYYLPFPGWVTASYYHAFTDADVRARDDDNDAYAIRYHHQVMSPVTLHVGYARGGETYDDLSIDRVGRFEAHTVEGAADVVLTRHWAVRVGGSHQARDNGQSVTTAFAGVSYHWQ
jgi:YaiO family outer membrane protein